MTLLPQCLRRLLCRNSQSFLSPGTIGKMELKNRIVCAPCGTHYSSHDGTVSDRVLAYYSERAKGGAGLIVTEGAGCRKRGKPGRILVNDDKYIPGLRKLADIIHKGGAKAVMQMSSHREAWTKSTRHLHRGSLILLQAGLLIFRSTPE